MNKQSRLFDKSRITSLHNGRQLQYVTLAQTWFIKLIIARLPGGVFTSGETWKRNSKGAYSRKHAWDYGPSDEVMRWTTKIVPPDYVKHIACELGKIMHKKFKHRGQLAAQKEQLLKKADGYWSGFGVRSQEFWDGVKEGIRAYSIWKDGEQYVGVMRRPQAEVFQEIDRIKIKESPIAEAARSFLEELGSPASADKDEIDRLVKFIENNALCVLYTYEEALFEEDQL